MSPSPPTRFLVALAAGSVLAAGFAVAVRAAIEATLALLLGDGNVLVAFRELPLWARFVAPPLGALVGGLVAAWATSRLPESHGVADVMEALVLGRGEVSLRSALAKAIASFFAIVGGGSLGREGPLIQVGAALAGHVGRRLGVARAHRRVLFAAGAAAGFAAAYNTPLAAVLFVVEVMAGVLALELLIPVALAAALATVVSRLTLGEGPFYGLRAFEIGSPIELGAVVALGPLGGLAGAGFMWLLAASERLFARLSPARRPLRAALGGAIVGGLAMLVPEVTGNGAEAIRELLDGRVIGLALLLLLFAKPLATAASVGSGSSGGVFTPSMFLGAALGAGAGHLLGAVSGHDGSGAFALVGLAAVVAATTHAPLLATVLAFEMSGDYALVVPLLAATVLATAAARAIRPDSLYAAEVARKGIAWEGSLASRIARAIRARDLLEPALIVPPSADTRAVLAELEERRARVAYARVGGEVRALDLREAHAAAARTPPPPFAGASRPVEPLGMDDELPRLMERLWSAEWGELPACNDGGEPAGIVTRRGLLGALDRELLRRDLLFSRLTYEGELAPLVELPPGQSVAVVPAPASWIGRALAPSEVRRELSVVVLSVGAEGARGPWRDPESVQRVDDGQRWLVLGPREAIERLTSATAAPR